MFPVHLWDFSFRINTYVVTQDSNFLLFQSLVSLNMVRYAAKDATLLLSFIYVTPLSSFTTCKRWFCILTFSPSLKYSTHTHTHTHTSADLTSQVSVFIFLLLMFRKTALVANISAWELLHFRKKNSLIAQHTQGFVFLLQLLASLFSKVLNVFLLLSSVFWQKLKKSHRWPSLLSNEWPKHHVCVCGFPSFNSCFYFVVRLKKTAQKNQHYATLLSATVLCRVW